MSRSLWCNPAVGVAGDMLLAALLDLGADRARVDAQLQTLELRGWELTSGSTTRHGLTATSVQVATPAHDHHRSWSTIDAMLAAAPLEEFVADGARRTFRRLGEAEAEVHGIDIDAVHFHEVGAVDAIIDIVGTWAALDALDIDSVHSAPIGLGTGIATMAHGVVPVPAPATLHLLIGHPTVPVEFAGETATPTGVALLTTMASGWGHLPAGRVTAVGRGAGSRDPGSHANLVTVVTFEPARSVDAPSSASTPSVLIETNLDDVTAEVVAHVIDRALALGADDAWSVPITMKKGRPAQQLRVLCRPEMSTSLRQLIASETGTLGLREWPIEKYELDRHMDQIVLDGHVVRIKVGPHGAKAEHDDLVVASTALGRPIRDLAAQALARWRGAPPD